MTPATIIAITEAYEENLRTGGFKKVRMPEDVSFGSRVTRELIEHAHFLCDGVKEFAAIPEKWGKANRHFASLQMCLSFAGVYTLADLMRHNVTGRVD